MQKVPCTISETISRTAITSKHGTTTPLIATFWLTTALNVRFDSGSVALKFDTMNRSCNYFVPLQGFAADTMHMARLEDSSRTSYSLESLSRDMLNRHKVMFSTGSELGVAR